MSPEGPVRQLYSYSVPSPLDCLKFQHRLFFLSLESAPPPPPPCPLSTVTDFLTKSFHILCCTLVQYCMMPTKANKTLLKSGEPPISLFAVFEPFWTHPTIKNQIDFLFQGNQRYFNFNNYSFSVTQNRILQSKHMVKYSR